MKLCLGTAQFSDDYGLTKPKLTAEEKQKILRHAWENGIDMVQVASGYGSKEVVESGLPFKVVKKASDGQRKTLMAMGKALGYSLYHVEDLPDESDTTIKFVQVPLNLYDQRFATHVVLLQDRGIAVHVRSIYLQGKLLKKYSMKMCMEYVKRFQPDRVVIGVDSLQQLKDNLATFHGMYIDPDDTRVDDEKRILPYKWGKT